MQKDYNSNRFEALTPQSELSDGQQRYAMKESSKNGFKSSATYFNSKGSHDQFRGPISINSEKHSFSKHRKSSN